MIPRVDLHTPGKIAKDLLFPVVNRGHSIDEGGENGGEIAQCASELLQHPVGDRMVKGRQKK